MIMKINELEAETACLKMYVRLIYPSRFILPKNTFSVNETLMLSVAEQHHTSTGFGHSDLDPCNIPTDLYCPFVPTSPL
jgi:hypothetical protein